MGSEIETLTAEISRLRFMVESLQRQAVENYDMRQVLLRLASEDYRGPEPHYRQMARDVLETAGRDRP